MGVDVRLDRCDGCPRAEEPFCVRICPGDLMYIADNGKAACRDEGACWDCVCCVKVCPQQAIEMRLSRQIAIGGAAMRARQLKSRTTWEVEHPDGAVETFETVGEVGTDASLTDSQL